MSFKFFSKIEGDGKNGNEENENGEVVVVGKIEIMSVEVEVGNEVVFEVVFEVEKEVEKEEEAGIVQLYGGSVSTKVLFLKLFVPLISIESLF